MDVRALICGVLSAIALVGAIVLAAMDKDTALISMLFGGATTFGGYVVGLYSSPYDEDHNA